MSRRKKILLGGLGLLLLVAAVITSGVIPIYASVDHPEPFASILDFAKKRSFATYSLGVEEPDRLEEDDALVMRGAGHYEQGCRFCHGVPWDRPPWARDALSPPPPELDRVAFEYDAAELYMIVNHGVVFTAMPAWPDRARNDEPWAVVAFLRALPELDQEGYRALIEVPVPAGAEMPEVVRARCIHCHGIDGLGRAGAFPILGGQKEDVLFAALRAYADNERHSGFMELPTADLSEAQMRDAAAYYAALPGLGHRGRGDADGDGARIAREGLPDRLIPPCASCHGPAEHEHAPNYPVLAGQHARYLREQLRVFEEGTRGGSPAAALMDPVSHHELRPAERRAVAAYYESLGR
ncbi:MAG: cytochrome C [Sandaracinus sp.]|nr:cytochrome C [Sandaracinus sp.]